MLKQLIAWAFLLIGLSLTLINLFGLTQSIRPEGLWDEPTRFENDYSIPYEEAIAQLKRLPEESELAFAQRATHVISQSITHIHWNEEPDNTRFNQLIPIWENYFLYFMGIWSGLPEYEKYHYTDYRRSIKRGIGLCGDTSMIMSEVLSENGIDSRIMTYPLHVVIEAHVDGEKRLFDADYGIALPFGSANVGKHVPKVQTLYREQGFEPDADKLVPIIFSGQAKAYNDVKAFVTKKYYFERISFGLKWPLPLVFVLIGWFLIRRQQQSQ